jgi:tRNA-dihydrouridine synthase C
MDGITDAPMRALQGEAGAFSYAVSEFQRVSGDPLPGKVFRREVPEVGHGCVTPTGLPVQVQILGGDPGRMAVSAQAAVRAGAMAIDINFGCPAPTVNRHDGGASLLKSPCRIRDIVSAVRDALPPEIPVSAKMRLGWDEIESIHENAAMAVAGGASWLTVHARTRAQGYKPPVYWEPLRKVREAIPIPLVANGDLWTREDFRRCREITGCVHFMIGRSAMADPSLSWAIAGELGLEVGPTPSLDWDRLLSRFVYWLDAYEQGYSTRPLERIKQWLSLAHRHGEFPLFDEIKRMKALDEVFDSLRTRTKLGVLG